MVKTKWSKLKTMFVTCFGETHHSQMHTIYVNDCIGTEKKMYMKFLIKLTREGIMVMLERILTFTCTCFHNIGMWSAS